MLELKDVSVVLKNNIILDNINLTIKKGEVISIIGPSGSGKSTLIRTMNHLVVPVKGSVKFMGEEINDKNIDKMRQHIGMVFQQYSLFPNLNVRDNVAYGLKLKKISKTEIQHKVENMLDIVGLSDKINQYPSQLSGRQQQRVALARAMVLEPKVLLLDEPLSAIDALLRKNLQVEIRDIQQRLGITTIFVTHDQEEAMVMSDMIHLFHDGEIEQSGTPEQIYTKPATKFAATFIGNYNILSADEMKSVFNYDVFPGEVAIRPEIIQLSKNLSNTDSMLTAQGKVKSYVSHGNMIRYEIQLTGLTIKADVIYKDGMEFDNNSIVYVGIPQNTIVRI